MTETHLRFLWRENGVARQFRTGVSLHSHTMHSRENLGFIPRCAEAFPPLAWELRRQARKYREKYNRDIDYTRGFWTPPLPAATAFDLESRNIEQELGLAALVSLTDHDNIEAAAQLRAAEATKAAPISMEWTVPAGLSYFHVGLYNLPPTAAESLVEECNQCARNPRVGLRNELLAALTERPETLVVLNHPFWDQANVGNETHEALLHGLLDDSGEFIHAFELNGLRPWKENQRVLDLARERGRPVVAGGDRHGCEPASVVNLTRAPSFAEFAAEMREGASEIVLLLRYREPVRLRVLKSVLDIMRDYPGLPGRERWTDRVFCCRYTGCTSSLSQMLNGSPPPHVVRYFERWVRLIGMRGLQDVARLFLADGEKWEQR